MLVQGGPCPIPPTTITDYYALARFRPSPPKWWLILSKAPYLKRQGGQWSATYLITPEGLLVGGDVDAVQQDGERLHEQLALYGLVQHCQARVPVQAGCLHHQRIVLRCACKPAAANQKTPSMQCHPAQSWCTGIKLSASP